jgi:hypothetical protein
MFMKQNVRSGVSCCFDGCNNRQGAYFQAITNLNSSACWPMQETIPPVGNFDDFVS